MARGEHAKQGLDRAKRKWEHIEGKSLGLFAEDSPLREWAFGIVYHRAFEYAILAIIFTNTFTLAYEPRDAGGQSVGFMVFERVTLCMFTLEMLLKIVVAGFFRGPHTYLHSHWNKLDFFVVCCGFLDLIPDLPINSAALRTVRILRPLRAFEFFDGMQVIWRALGKSARLLLSVTYVFAFSLVVFAIIGLETLGGSLRNRCAINGDPTQLYGQNQFCDATTDLRVGVDCANAGPPGLNLSCVDVGYNPNHDITSWDDFFDAIYTVFEVSTLENWSNVMYMAMDAEGDFASLYFVAIIVFCTFLVLNLAVSIICAVYSREWAAHEARLAEKADKKYQKTLNRQFHDLAAEGLPDFNSDGEGLPESLQRANQATSESTLVQRARAHSRSVRLTPLATNASMPAMDVRGPAWSMSRGRSTAASPSPAPSSVPPSDDPPLGSSVSIGSACEPDVSAPPKARRRSLSQSRNDRELGRRISLAAARDVALFIEGGNGRGSVDMVGFGGAAQQAPAAALPDPVERARSGRQSHDVRRSMPLAAARHAPLGNHTPGDTRASVRLPVASPGRGAGGRWVASTRFVSPLDPDNPWAARTLTHASLAPVSGGNSSPRRDRRTAGQSAKGDESGGEGADSSDDAEAVRPASAARPPSGWFSPPGRHKAKRVMSSRRRDPSTGVELRPVSLTSEDSRVRSGRVVLHDNSFQAQSMCSGMEGEEEEEEEEEAEADEDEENHPGWKTEVALPADVSDFAPAGPYTSTPTARVKQARRRSMSQQTSAIAAAQAAQAGKGAGTEECDDSLLPPAPDAKEFPREKPPQWLWRTVMVIILVQTGLLFPDTSALSPLTARLIFAGQCATTAALLGEFAFRCTLVRSFTHGMLRHRIAMFEFVLVAAQIGFVAVVAFVFEGGTVPLRAVDTTLPSFAMQGMRVAMAAQFVRVIYLVPAIRTMLLIAFGTAHSIFSLFALVIVLLIMLAVFMMQLFYKRLPDEGISARFNFDSFGRSVLSLFIVLVGDNWNSMYYACWRAGGMAWIVTPVFIIGWYLLANSVLLNVFIAVVLGNFQVAEEMREEYQNYLYRMELTRSIQQWEEEELAQGADDEEGSGGSGQGPARTFRPDATAVSAAAADIGGTPRARAPSSIGALAQPEGERTVLGRARVAVGGALRLLGLGPAEEGDLGSSIQAYAQAVHTPSEGDSARSRGSSAGNASPHGPGRDVGEFPTALALQAVKARVREDVKAEDEALEEEEEYGGSGADGGGGGDDAAADRPLEASLGAHPYHGDSAHSLGSPTSRSSVAARLSWLGLRGRERQLTGIGPEDVAAITAAPAGRKRGGTVWGKGAGTADTAGTGNGAAKPGADGDQQQKTREARRRLRRASVAVAERPAFALMAQKSRVFEPDEVGERGDEEAGWHGNASSSSSAGAAGQVAVPSMQRQRNLHARVPVPASPNRSRRGIIGLRQDSGASSASGAQSALAARSHAAARAARDERTLAKVRELAPEVAEAEERDGPSWWAWAFGRGRQMLWRSDPDGKGRRTPKMCARWLELDHPLRRAARAVTASLPFRAGVAASILASCVFLAMEKHENKTDPLFRTADIAIVCVFSAEVVVRVLGHGLWGRPQAYLRNPWNQLDALVLATMLVNVAAGVEYRTTLSWWERGLRVTRTLRAVRLIRYNRTMRLLCSSLVVGARHIALSAAAFFAVYFFFSVLGHEMFRDRFGRCNVPSVPDRASCVGVHLVGGEEVTAQWTVPPANFDTLGRSMQTMFQVATLEGYIDVMGDAMDVTGVDQQPRTDASFFNSVFFVLFISVVSFVALQLFTGVILDSIVRSTGRHMWTQQQRQWNYMAKLIHASKPQYQRESLDPRQRRFVSLRQACVDVCIHCNHNRDECPRRWHHIHSRFDKLVLVLILLNALLMCLRHNPMSPSFERFMTVSSHAFLGAFTLEMAIKLTAFGPRGYWHDIANVFDGVLVIGALSLLVVDMSGVALGAQLARIFRIGRLVRVIRGSPSLRVLFQTLYASLPSLLNVTLLVLLVFFVYAVAGMEMYGSLGLAGTQPPPDSLTAITTHANFHSIGNALLTLFRITTGEDWQDIMFDCERKSPHASPIYFISFYVLGVYIFLNFYLGSILENFEYCYGVNQGSMDLQDLAIFRRTWAHFDPKARGALPLSCLEDFLLRLTLPRKNPDAYALQEDAEKEDSAIDARARELNVIQRAQNLAATRKNADDKTLRHNEQRQRAQVKGVRPDGKTLSEADRRDPMRRARQRQETARRLEKRWQSEWGSRRDMRPSEAGKDAGGGRTWRSRLAGMLPAWLRRCCCCCGCGGGSASSDRSSSSRRRKLFRVTADFQPTPFQRYIRESLLDRRWVRLLKLEMRVVERASGREGRRCRYGALLMALARRRFGPKALPVEERVRAEFEFRFLETLDGVLRVQALVRGRIMRRRLRKEREGAQRAAALPATASYWHARSGTSRLNVLAMPHVQRAMACGKGHGGVSILRTIRDGADEGEGKGGDASQAAAAGTAGGADVHSARQTTARDRLGPPPAVPLPMPPPSTPPPPAPSSADGPTRLHDNPFHNQSGPAAGGAGAHGRGIQSRHNAALRDSAAPWARSGPRRGGARLPRGK